MAASPNLVLIVNKSMHRKAPHLIVAMLISSLLGLIICSREAPLDCSSATQNILHKVNATDIAQNVTQIADLTLPGTATTYEFHYRPENSPKKSSSSIPLLDGGFDLATFKLNPVYCAFESAYLLYVHNGTFSESVVFRGKNNADIPNLHYFQDIFTKSLDDYSLLRYQFEFIKTSPHWTPIIASITTGLFSSLTFYELWQTNVFIGPLSILIPLDTYISLVGLGSSLIALEFALLCHTPVWELPVDQRSTFIVVSICIGILVLLTGWLAFCNTNHDDPLAKLIGCTKKVSKILCAYYNKMKPESVNEHAQWYNWANETTTKNFSSPSDEDIKNNFEEVGRFRNKAHPPSPNYFMNLMIRCR